MAGVTPSPGTLAETSDAVLAKHFRAAHEAAQDYRAELERRGWSIDARSAPPKISKRKTVVEDL